MYSIVFYSNELKAQPICPIQWDFNSNPCRTIFSPTTNLNYIQGSVGINYDTYPSVRFTDDIPTLLIHSYRITEGGNSFFHPSIVRLQSGNAVGQNPEDLFQKSIIEFWSNNYGSTNQWMTGKIESFNAAHTDEQLNPTSTNFYGGLKFYCSDGPGFGSAIGPYQKEVIRIVDGKVGIGFITNYFPVSLPLQIPKYTLDVRGDIGVGGGDIFLNSKDGSIAIRSMLDNINDEINNIERFHIYNNAYYNISFYMWLPELFRHGLAISFGELPGYFG